MRVDERLFDVFHLKQIEDETHLYFAYPCYNEIQLLHCALPCYNEFRTALHKTSKVNHQYLSKNDAN